MLHDPNPIADLARLRPLADRLHVLELAGTVGAGVENPAMRVAIGDFSKMTHLSVKALRHYHDVGVLVPAEVDPASGYRYYGQAQVPVAQVIRRFRELGMPLEEIREVLGAPDVGARNELIAAHLRRMEAQLAGTRSIVASLRALLAGPPAPITVEHRSVGAKRAVGISGHVPPAGLDDWWDTAFHALDAVLTVAAAGPRAALYSAGYFEQDGGEVVAYVPVEAEVPVGAGPARMLDIPAAELAVAVHRGGYADLDRTYGALGTYVAEREIGVAGPIREVYVVSAFDTGDESRHVTEVCWPVFRLAT